jgi:hypothetical protein
MSAGARVVFGILVVAAAMTAGGSAEARLGLRDEAREKAAAAQQRFQQDMYDMLASRWGHLEGLAAAQRDLQLAYIEAQSLRFYFLLQHDPAKIVRDQGISPFLNFDWTDENNDQLRADSPEYMELEKRIKKLRGRSDGHAQWPEAREKALSLQSEPDFQDAMERLKEAFEEVEELLDANQSGGQR